MKSPVIKLDNVNRYVMASLFAGSVTNVALCEADVNTASSAMSL
jgi:hypothetical protein